MTTDIHLSHCYQYVRILQNLAAECVSDLKFGSPSSIIPFDQLVPSMDVSVTVSTYSLSDIRI
jgi:hypothetical protein